ncbi:hypothetical protein L1D14_23010 [Vibrio tubiashii]|uniref:hypothetical protein n=1 Tax=Vibrio tubiashii TaxID=29498 RepID=UPI001EFCE8BA|nr:hypothetical protein [Vibrio tubiashii]MCG9579075.1 hypothetical protein [Vibrio tubiashii]
MRNISFSNIFSGRLPTPQNLQTVTFYNPDSNTRKSALYSKLHLALLANEEGEVATFSPEVAKALSEQDNPFVEGVSLKWCIARNCHDNVFMLGPKGVINLYPYDEPIQRATSVVYCGDTGIILTSNMNLSQASDYIEQFERQTGRQHLRAVMHLTFEQHSHETLKDIVGQRISELHNSSFVVQ